MKYAHLSIVDYWMKAESQAQFKQVNTRIQRRAFNIATECRVMQFKPLRLSTYNTTTLRHKRLSNMPHKSRWRWKRWILHTQLKSCIQRCMPDTSCLQLPLRMSNSAFQWNSLRRGLSQSVIFLKLARYFILSSFATVYLQMAYYVTINWGRQYVVYAECWFPGQLYFKRDGSWNATLIKTRRRRFYLVAEKNIIYYIRLRLIWRRPNGRIKEISSVVVWSSFSESLW